MRRDQDTGGDSACWAHLFEDERDGIYQSGASTNLAALANAALGRGPVWTQESTDLNVNLLLFHAGEGVDEHINSEVDVLMVGVSGSGVVTIDGLPHSLPAGHCVLVPKGARRSTRAFSDRFAYLTCHRRRGGLVPKLGKRQAPDSP
jgi:mannose-6-phosphate isomerase-like protein (cupin superfamily)